MDKVIDCCEKCGFYNIKKEALWGFCAMYGAPHKPEFSCGSFAKKGNKPGIK